MQHFLGGISPTHLWNTQLHMQCYQALKKSSPLFLESFLFRKEVKEVSGCFFSVWEEQTNIHTYSIVAKLLLKFVRHIHTTIVVYIENYKTSVFKSISFIGKIFFDKFSVEVGHIPIEPDNLEGQIAK